MPKGFTISHRTMKGVRILFFTLLLISPPGLRVATAQDMEEYAVKSAFIFNFTKFVQWPENTFSGDKQVYHILVFGSAEVARQLIAIDGQNNGKGIIRVHHSNPETVEKDETFPQCQIVFISKEIHPPECQRILRHTEGKPILSIGETRNFSRMGGIINFFTKDDRLHFEINAQTARLCGLQISFRLLRIAFIVDE